MLQESPPLSLQFYALDLTSAINFIPLQKFLRQFESQPGNDMLAEIYSMLAQLMFNTQRVEQVRAFFTFYMRLQSEPTSYFAFFRLYLTRAKRTR
jgi:hypothetical protein